MMDINIEKQNLRDKKLFKVHADITVYGQFTSRVIPLSISIIATNEQEAKNIARHVKITDVNITNVKEEVDFTKHIHNEDNNIKE